MSQGVLRIAGLAISLLVAGLALISAASAHESHGGRPMTGPGYQWGSHGMVAPRAGMWHHHGSMTYGPCQSPEGYGWQHHGQSRRQHMGPGMMGQGHMASPGRPMSQGMMGPMTGPMMGPGARTMPGDAFGMGSPLADDLTVE